MALITLYDFDDNHELKGKEISFNGLAWEWCVENIPSGVNFKVYENSVCEENEITCNMRDAEDVYIIMMPAGLDPITWAYIIGAVVAVGVTLLVPTPDPLVNVNRQQNSPNNALTDRNNRLRKDQRIVDIIGEVKSVPDVMQNEFQKYDPTTKREERIGAYVVGRGRIDIRELRDADNLINDTIGSQAEIYYPYKSPNNSAPDEVVNATEPNINEPIVGVYKSTVAIGSTLDAPKNKGIKITDDFSSVVRFDTYTGIIYDLSIDFLAEYNVGDDIELVDLWATYYANGDDQYLKLSGLAQVTDVFSGSLYFDISNISNWAALPSDGINYDIVYSYPTTFQRQTDSGFETVQSSVVLIPSIISSAQAASDTYKITSAKVDRILANVYCPNGLYKRSTGGKEAAYVGFAIGYWRLDDDFIRVGAEQTLNGTLADKTDDQVGFTLDVDLGTATYVEWYTYRTTFEDLQYDGTVVDVIKLKSLFGLYDINRSDFGNVTMIQTKRTQVEQVTAIANPQVNCIATEMLYKYEGAGVFDTVLTKNTQAFQSLISRALDDKIGRMTVDELDLDLLLQTQSDIETYYQNPKAGRCCYSLDSTNTTAQEVFTLIANSVSCILWREGRVLKSWFESPQTIPEMVFTHRSKEPNSETWNRSFKQNKDGVSFKYTDEITHSQEELIYPVGAKNPKSFEIPGIKGIELATWRMKREFNKLVNQRITVDFTAKEEGRFVKPNKLISVVKGSRVGSTDGYVMAVNGLVIELSQEVTFTAGDDHFILFKKRDGSTQSIQCTETTNKRIITLLFAPVESLYSGNNALKTEFSFGNEARLSGQLILPQTIDASDKYSTKISGINYSDAYYASDPVQPIQSAFDAGFSSGFF